MANGHSVSRAPSPTDFGRCAFAGRWVAIAVACGLLLASSVALAGGTHELTIRSGAAAHAFVVEHAVTPDERARGLMFRRHLPPDHGMLFDFGTPRIITMWMRNTPIPLDMVFADSDGTIVHIAPRTTPYSERTVSSRQPARYVLEINGGRAKALGVKTGDLLSGPLIAEP